MTDAVILSGARTPVGKFMGALKDFSAVDLGVIAARAAIERACPPCALCVLAAVRTLVLTGEPRQIDAPRPRHTCPTEVLPDPSWAEVSCRSSMRVELAPLRGVPP